MLAGVSASTGFLGESRIALGVSRHQTAAC